MLCLNKLAIESNPYVSFFDFFSVNKKLHDIIMSNTIGEGETREILVNVLLSFFKERKGREGKIKYKTIRPILGEVKEMCRNYMFDPTTSLLSFQRRA